MAKCEAPPAPEAETATAPSLHGRNETRVCTKVDWALVCARVNFMYFPSLERKFCVFGRVLAPKEGEKKREQPRKCYTFR